MARANTQQSKADAQIPRGNGHTRREAHTRARTATPLPHSMHTPPTEAQFLDDNDDGRRKSTAPTQK